MSNFPTQALPIHTPLGSSPSVTLQVGANPKSQPTHGAAQNAAVAKPSSKLAAAWQCIKKAWSWANKSPLRQFLLGVAGIAVGATISVATGGALGLLGLPFILTGAYMVIKAVSKVPWVQSKLDGVLGKGSSEQQTSQNAQTTVVPPAVNTISSHQDTNNFGLQRSNSLP